MAEAKRSSIDLVKVVGIALAVAIFFGGQFYFSAQNEKRAAEWQAQQAELRRQELLKKTEPVLVSPKSSLDPSVEAKSGEALPAEAKTAKTAEGAKTGDPNGETPAPVKVEQAAPVGDVVLGGAEGDLLKLTLTQAGATLKHGMLAQERVLAQTPDDEKGLELLDEIEPGKRSLALVKFRFNAYEFTDLESRLWEKEAAGEPSDEAAVAYATTLADTEGKPLAKVFKRFVLPPQGQHLLLEVRVQNLTGQPATYAYQLRGPAGILLDGPKHDPEQGTYVQLKLQLASRLISQEHPDVLTQFPHPADKVPDLEDRRVSGEENLWAALSNRFFLTALVALRPTQVVQIVAEPIFGKKREDKLDDKRFHYDNLTPIFFRKESEPLAAGATGEAEPYALYLGPLQPEHIRDWEASLALPRPMHLEEAVQYCDIWGTRWPRVDWLSGMLLAIFRGIQSLFGSWGLAVILLTLVVKVALHPMQRKMNVSMHKMQMLQPKLAAIEEKYKTQTKPEQKQKKEMEKWDLMRKEGVNPTMGCLPMLLQMPIFFALYGTFARAFEIRHAKFLWVEDLSLQDRFMHVAIWPHELNLLPVIYIAMTIVTTLRMPKPENPDPQQEMQRKMMSFMPVMFGVLFYRMPAGLILYFAASACFGLIETWYIKRFVLKVDKHGKPLATAGLPVEPKAATR